METGIEKGKGKEKVGNEKRGWDPGVGKTRTVNWVQCLVTAHSF